jgi:hypothetical protein
VPPGRLYDLQAGQRVAVRAGFIQLGGQIERVYPIAPALPPEFSLAFDSTQRHQLIKITLDGQPPESMPLFSTVRVTGPWNPVSRAMDLINRVIGAG